MNEQHNEADLRPQQYLKGLRVYEEAQHQFLRAIEEHVPEALIELKTSVLPLWNAAKHRLKYHFPIWRGPWVPCRGYGTSKSRRYFPNITKVLQLSGCNPRGVSAIQGPEYAKSVYQAVWEWAAHYGLVESKDVPSLKILDPVLIVNLGKLYYCLGNFDDFHCVISETSDASLAPDSSAVTFGLTALSRVVRSTLKTWCEAPPENELRWTFPAPLSWPSIDDGNLSRIMRHLGVLGFPIKQVKPPDLPFETYEFTSVRPWDITREKRRDAETRIRDDLNAELKKTMDQQKEFARLHCKVEKRSRIINPEQFVWLAMYQVGESTKYKLAKGDSDTEKNISLSIQRAAKRVIGPTWESWIRPPGTSNCFAPVESGRFLRAS